MSNSNKARVLGLIGMALAAVLIIVLAAVFRNNKNVEVSSHSFAMGSVVTVKLYGAGDTEAAEEVQAAVKLLDEECISWRNDTSELGKWNRTAEAGCPVEISKDLANVLEKSLSLADASDGALDITLRPVLDVWGIEDADEKTFRVPEEEELKKAAEKCGRKDITLTVAEGSERNLLTRNREEVSLDLGALGKGYALDIAYDLLQGKKDVTGGVIAVGGSVLIFGEKPDGGEYKVGIRDPEGLPEDVMGHITFPSGTKKACVSTSGGYEKYVEKDGVKYHHIIDPKTLRPAKSGLKSVTVVCEDGAYSDGLSTACFILGEEKGVKLLEKYGAEGVFIREDGSTFITNGLSGRVIFE